VVLPLLAKSVQSLRTAVFKSGLRCDVKCGSPALTAGLPPTLLPDLRITGESIPGLWKGLACPPPEKLLASNPKQVRVAKLFDSITCRDDCIPFYHLSDLLALIHYHKVDH
jgi:hypothetical protein